MGCKRPDKYCRGNAAQNGAGFVDLASVGDCARPFKVSEITFAQHGDARGQLIALEGMSEQIPFEVRRFYYIFDTTPGTIRGKHAHRQLKQVLICPSGACTIVCELPDGTRGEYRLDWPNKGLLIEGLVWREMKDFSKDAVLMVLASEHYDERDYIRDYEIFRKESVLIMERQA